MKKISYFTISAVVISLLSSSLLCYAATVNFKDIKTTNWAYSYVNKLVEKGGINGYNDGTFKPNNTITNAEFIKTLIGTTIGEQKKTDSHWASGYIDKAVELGILEINELTLSKYDEPMTRELMAVTINRTAKTILKENFDCKDRNTIVESITDFRKITENYKNSVVYVYYAGIITGYSDGTFSPQKTATRAEACTMIVRLLDKSQRKSFILAENTKLQDTFTYTFKSGESVTLPQKLANLNDLNIAKIDIYNNNKIRVFSKVEQDFGVFIGNSFTTQSVAADSNYWLVDGYKMYLFTSQVDPKGQEIRIELGNVIYLIKGVTL